MSLTWKNIKVWFKGMMDFLPWFNVILKLFRDGLFFLIF